MAINLSEADIRALEALVATEVGAGWRGATLDEGVAAIVDTVLNRVESDSYPDTLSDVINQRKQFSDINYPGRPSAYGSWENVPESRINKQNAGGIREAVRKAVSERTAGVGSAVAGHLNYANPHHSSKVNVQPGGWVHAMMQDPYKWTGVGKSSHVHGTDPNMEPLPQAPQVGFFPSFENNKPGIDDESIFDAPDSLDRLAPPIPTTKDGVKQVNPTRELLLDRIENPTDYRKVGPPRRPPINGAGGLNLPDLPQPGTMAEPVGSAPVTPVEEGALPALPGPINVKASVGPAVKPQNRATGTVDLSSYGEPLQPLDRGPSQRLGPRGSRSGGQEPTFGPPIANAGQPSNVGASRIQDDTAPATIEQMRDMLGQTPKPPIDYGMPAPKAPEPVAPQWSTARPDLPPIDAGLPAPGPAAPTTVAPQSSTARPDLPKIDEKPSINKSINDRAVPHPEAIPSSGLPPVPGAPATSLPAIDAPVVDGVGIPRNKPDVPKPENKLGKNIGRGVGAVAGGLALGPVGALAGSYIGSKIGQNGLPEIGNLNLGPVVSREGYERTPAGRAAREATRNGGFNNHTFTSTYARAGGSDDGGSYAQALAEEQRQRSQAGQRTVGDAFSDFLGSIF